MAPDLLKCTVNDINTGKGRNRPKAIFCVISKVKCRSVLTKRPGEEEVCQLSSRQEPIGDKWSFLPTI